MIGGKYSWKVGGFHPKADANKIGAEIETIETKTPQAIVDYARSNETELHKCFEWDDSVAAETYRREQANTLLNNLVYVVREDVNSVPKEVKAFVNTKKKEEYKPIEYVLRSPTEYQKLKDKAMRELMSTRNKYSEVTEYQDIYELIDEKAKEYLNI